MGDLKKRITLTLLATTLERVEKIAAERQVTVSTVVAELLKDGCRFAPRLGGLTMCSPRTGRRSRDSPKRNGSCWTAWIWNRGVERSAIELKCHDI